MKDIKGDVTKVVRGALPIMADTLRSMLPNISSVVNSSGADFAESFGETEIDGIEYQMQIHFVANKDMWIPENEFRAYESNLKE